MSACCSVDFVAVGPGPCRLHLLVTTSCAEHGERSLMDLRGPTSVRLELAPLVAFLRSLPCGGPDDETRDDGVPE